MNINMRFLLRNRSRASGVQTLYRPGLWLWTPLGISVPQTLCMSSLRNSLT